MHTKSLLHLWSTAVLGLLFCVNSKVITDNEEWKTCCKDCPWEWDNTDRYARICQYYDNKHYYATLYDTKNRIPVFSQYKIDPKDANRPRNKFAIEPGLIDFSDVKDMTMHGNIDKLSDGTGKRQAIPDDYYKLEEWNKGHLNPSSGHQDENAAKATYTLTNIVPQVSSFNGKCWTNLEKLARDYVRSKNQCNNMDNTVVVGAVPGETSLKNRVNVPSYMWYYIQCSGRSKVLAVIVPNLDNNDLADKVHLLYFEEEKLAEFIKDIENLYEVNGKALMDREVTNICIKYKPTKIPTFVKSCIQNQCCKCMCQEMAITKEENSVKDEI